MSGPPRESFDVMKSNVFVFVNRELGIEAGVTVAPYPSGHLHSHLPHYHPPPRLHHFPIPFMVRQSFPTNAYICIIEKESLLYKPCLRLMVLAACS